TAVVFACRSSAIFSFSSRKSGDHQRSLWKNPLVFMPQSTQQEQISIRAFVVAAGQKPLFHVFHSPYYYY
ncbi:MAG: hypothetical protein J6A48_03930, partial [Clostridia bacterium]|nr:hypothetical protein [Clostridia bacterium]